MGLRDSCPSSPRGVARYGRALVTALRNDRVVLPAPRSANLALNRAALADELEALIGPLEAALDAVTREESEAKGAQTAKDEAMEANDDAFAVGTGVGRAVFRLCGLTELADRIREAARQPGRLAEPPAPAGDGSAA